MSDNNEQRQPPSLADIVREKTNDGDTIVQFYRDVIQGKLDDEGFEACHKLEAAMQVHAIAPEVVAEPSARLDRHPVPPQAARQTPCRQPSFP